MPRERPAHRAAAGHAAGADRHIRRLARHGLERRQEPRNVGRIVAEVGIHVYRDFEATAAGEPKAFEDRTAQAAATAADEHVEARLATGPLAGDLPCAIGRIVVDDQELNVGRAGEHGIDQMLDVFPFVVGGRLHEHAAGRPVVAGVEVVVGHEEDRL